MLTRLVAYQVNSDGHWDPVAFTKKDLKAKQAYILVDEQRREIWIWIGQGSNVKTRFILSTAATEIRRLYGLTYRVRTEEQGEESKTFLECIDSLPSKGLVPQLTDKKSKAPKEKKVTTSKPKAAKKKTTKRTTKKKTTATKTKATKTVSKTEKKPRRTRKSTTKKTSPKPKKSLDKYLPQDIDIITTPPCPECGIGHLLPYSEKLEQDDRDPIILPFSKWICSKCEYSPPHV
jgi:hypothetical protein